jgi:hypothetical protein
MLGQHVLTLRERPDNRRQLAVLVSYRDTHEPPRVFTTPGTQRRLRPRCLNTVDQASSVTKRARVYRWQRRRLMGDWDGDGVDTIGGTSRAPEPAQR